MKIRPLAKQIGYCALGALTLMGASLPQALADGQAQLAHSMEHGPAMQPSKRANELIRTVRDATARFRDVSAAQAEGYNLMFGCVTGPDFGAMGLHYVKLPLVGDGEIDARYPEIVIYEPQTNGRLKMTGADFLVLAADWDKKHPGQPPELMGQLFHLFEAPNRFGLPAFYTLHVWAWKENPFGSFTNWHPQVSCDGFDGDKH